MNNVIVIKLLYSRDNTLKAIGHVYYTLEFRRLEGYLRTEEFTSRKEAYLFMKYE